MIILKIAEALNRKDERGFTLIELLIVIAILAILAAIAIPLVGNRIAEARNAADEANVRMLQGAVDLWLLDNPDATDLSSGNVTDGSSGFIGELIAANYLTKEVPSPHGETYGYTLTITLAADGKPKVYTVTAFAPAG